METTIARLESICDNLAAEVATTREATLNQVGDAMLPYLADVTEANKGEKFDTVLEEVLMIRLRAMKAKLAEMGVQM